MQYLKLYKTVMSYFYLMLNYQLNILEKISDTLHGKGKAVNDSIPISPVHKLHDGMEV